MSPDDPETTAAGGPEDAAPIGGADDNEAVAAQWAQMLAEQKAAQNAAQAGGTEPGPTGEEIEDPLGHEGVQPLRFPQMGDAPHARGGGGIDLLLDVKLPISVELGRAEMAIKEIMAFSPGAIIELDKMAGDMVDVLVNGRLVAQGEVVVVDEHFGVRVTNLLSPEERVRSLA